MKVVVKIVVKNIYFVKYKLIFEKKNSFDQNNNCVVYIIEY